jgi:hypothetical protein
MEQELQMPSCLFGGPPARDDIIKLGESQIGFMNIFAMPLFEAVTDILPAMHFAVDEILANKAVWESKILDERQRRKKKPSLLLGQPSFATDSTPSPFSGDSGKPLQQEAVLPVLVSTQKANAEGVRRDSTGSVRAAVITSRRSSIGGEKRIPGTGIGGQRGSMSRDEQESRRGSGDASLTAILVTHAPNSSDSPARESTPKPEDCNRGPRKDTLTQSTSRKKDKGSTRPVTAPSQARRSQGKQQNSSTTLFNRLS